MKAPLALWGPCLWAQGNALRKLDRLVWSEEAVRADRLHPSEAGCTKITTLLLNFFKTSEGTSPWFLEPGEQPRIGPLPR